MLMKFRTTMSIADLGAPLRSIAAGLAIADGLIHLGVAPAHFQEAAAAGAFMAGTGVALVVAGSLLLVWPSRQLIAATMLGTVLLLLLYAAVHTVGLPVGPHAGHSHQLQVIDAVSKMTELLLLLVLTGLIGMGTLSSVPTVAGRRDGADPKAAAQRRSTGKGKRYHRSSGR